MDALFAELEEGAAGALLFPRMAAILASVCSVVAGVGANVDTTGVIGVAASSSVSLAVEGAECAYSAATAAIASLAPFLIEQQQVQQRQQEQRNQQLMYSSHQRMLQQQQQQQQQHLQEQQCQVQSNSLKQHINQQYTVSLNKLKADQTHRFHTMSAQLSMKTAASIEAIPETYTPERKELLLQQYFALHGNKLKMLQDRHMVTCDREQRMFVAHWEKEAAALLRAERGETLYTATTSTISKGLQPQQQWLGPTEPCSSWLAAARRP